MTILAIDGDQMQGAADGVWLLIIAGVAIVVAWLSLVAGIFWMVWQSRPAKLER